MQVEEQYTVPLGIIFQRQFVRGILAGAFKG